MRYLEFPNNVQIETISSCNARCGFCPYPETSRSQPQGVMDDELFASIVDQLSRESVHLIQPFLNNDPLTDRKIVPRLAAIIRANPRARVMVTTNGLLLRDPVIDGLVGLDLDTIHVSSNGLTADVYRRTMRIDGYAVLRNVNRLWDEIRRRGARTKLVVTSILMAANEREVRHMREYWHARGVAFYLNPLNDRAGNLPTEQFVQLLPFNRDAKRTQMYSADMSGCPSLYSFMGIHWNGDVIRCFSDLRRVAEDLVIDGNLAHQRSPGRPHSRTRRRSACATRPPHAAIERWS